MTATVTTHNLTQFGLIRYSGDEAQSFLHNQLSCDVGALTLARCTYGAYCTPKGRALASFLLWRSEQGFFMQLPSSLREPIQKQLSKFILRAKVTASDATGKWTLVGLAGKDAGMLVGRALGQAPQATLDVLHVEGTTVIRMPGDRYEMVIPSERRETLLAVLETGSTKADPGQWDRLDIRAGVPTILPETQEAFVPQMVNLDLIGGVSYEKGCYPGQEIVARMHYRGTLKQRMYLASIASNDPPQPGEKLFSSAFGEQACGTIVNAARAPQGGFDALAVLQIASAEQGDVHWKAPEGPALKLQPLPYTF